MEAKINKMPLAFFKGDLERTKKHVRIVLAIVMAVSVIVQMSLGFPVGVKAALIFCVSILVARETEIFFITQKEGVSRRSAKLLIATTAPEITAMIYALLLPVATPLFVVAIGAFVGIFVGKMIFGGYSYNIFNPAIIGRLFVAISWPALISLGYVDSLENFVLETIFKQDFPTNVLSPLMELQANGIVSLDNMSSIEELLFTINPGMLYSIPAVFYILILIYFLMNKVVDLFTMLITIIAMVILTSVVAFNFDLGFNYVLFHLFSGGLLFALLFIVTDPFTKPYTKYGMIIYSVILVVSLSLIRFIGKDADGILYALLFANLFVPLLNKKTLKNKLKLTWQNIMMLVLSITVLIGTGIFINSILTDRIASGDIIVGGYNEE